MNPCKTSDFIKPFARAAWALAGLLAIGTGIAQAAWPTVSVPKSELPKFLTKPAKVQTELPPKEAADACITTAKDLLDHGHDREATCYSSEPVHWIQNALK